MRADRRTDATRPNSLKRMATLARAAAALRIIGADLVPTEVSRLLGCESTTSYAKGDTLTSIGVTRVARVGMWLLQAEETEPADLDTQVAAILNHLNDDASVWEHLRAQFDVSLFCGWFMERGNEGTCIEPTTMSALGTRGIRLDIDMYSGDGERDAR